MVTLDSRCKQLLVVLLQADKPMPASLLAKKLHITARMARYRLNRVELWLHMHGVQVSKRPGVGIQIQGSPALKHSLLLELDQASAETLILSPHERIYLLIVTLLFDNEPVVVKQLQKKLYVSRTTVLKDFKEVDLWLEKYSLWLNRRQNYGCQIEGNESDIREALVDCLIEGIGEESLLSFVGDKYAFYQPANVEQLSVERPYFIHLLEKLNLDYFSRLILQEEAGKLSLTDRALVILVLCLAILVYRIHNGKSLEEGYLIPIEIKEQETFQLAEVLANKINRQLGIRISEQELLYLAHQLSKADVRKSVTNLLVKNKPPSQELEGEKGQFSPNILALAEEIVTYASVYLHPSLKVDAELLSNLEEHLTHLPLPDSSRLKLRNPLLADIKREYSHIYQIAETCIDIIGRHLGYYIPDDEISYITMYLAAAMERLCISDRKKKILVICNAGRATAQLLVSRIRAEFPGIEIAGVMSYLEWKNRIDSIEYDLIVSTILIQTKDTPVVLASPLLSPQDIANIRAILDTKLKISTAKTKLSKDGQICLSDLITAETIKLNALASNWQQAIEQAGELLHKKHQIDLRYIEAMKDTIITFGPYMVIWPGTVLLHARPEDGVRQLCMSLTTFREPVTFGHAKHDPVVMAFVLGSVDSSSHMPALYELNDLMQNSQQAASLKSAANSQRVVRILEEHCRSQSR
jgi:mannitol operon transcriptional antiterminator